MYHVVIHDWPTSCRILSSTGGVKIVPFLKATSSVASPLKFPLSPDPMLLNSSGTIKVKPSIALALTIIPIPFGKLATRDVGELRVIVAFICSNVSFVFETLARISLPSKNTRSGSVSFSPGRRTCVNYNNYGKKYSYNIHCMWACFNNKTVVTCSKGFIYDLRIEGDAELSKKVKL